MVSPLVDLTSKTKKRESEEVIEGRGRGMKKVSFENGNGKVLLYYII